MYFIFTSQWFIYITLCLTIVQTFTHAKQSLNHTYTHTHTKNYCGQQGKDRFQ